MLNTSPKVAVYFSDLGDTREPANRIHAAVAMTRKVEAAEELLRFGPTDFTAVARSFGLTGIRVEKPGDIAPALGEAMNSKHTVVVDVVTDIEARAPAPWAPQEG